MITLASSNPDTPAYTEEIPCTDSVPCEIAAEDIPVQMEQDHEWQKKRPSPQEEGEGRITCLEIRIAYARKSPLEQCPLRAYLAPRPLWVAKQDAELR
jgi:hypothetical protein